MALRPGEIIDADTLAEALATDESFTGRYPLLENGPINVEQEFGTASTNIDAAVALAASSGRPLYFGPGSFTYSGTGWAAAGDITVMGAGRDLTTITLSAGAYFIDTPTALDTILIADLTFSGGAGAVRSSSTGVNVSGQKVFQRCKFTGYTKAAVVHHQSDSPYWKFDRCVFSGADYDTTIGVALAAGTDGCSFVDCEFLRNRVSIKVGGGGDNCYINDCDFIRFSAVRPSGPAVDVWVVPQASTYTNSGQGFHAKGCKFGNENFVAGDLKVVYADEGSGTDFGTKFPDLSTASTGRIGGHSFDGCYFATSSSAPGPIIFSTTPNIAGLRLGPLVVGGPTGLTYFVEFLAAAIPGPDRLTNTNILGPITGTDVGTETVLLARPSNADGVFHIVDPQGLFAARPDTRMSHPGASVPSDYIELISTRVPSFTNVGAVGGTTGIDAFFGAEAVDITTLDTTGIRTALLPALVPGLPLWVEWELKSSGASPLTQVRVSLQYTSSGAIHWREIVAVPASGWAPFRFPVTLRAEAATINLQFTTVTGTGSVSIGRVRCYHAREPINIEGRFPSLHTAGEAVIAGNLYHAGTLLGFYGTSPIAKQTGVAVTTAAVHAALVNLGLIAP